MEFRTAYECPALRCGRQAREDKVGRIKAIDVRHAYLWQKAAVARKAGNRHLSRG
ncbi:hypothetical protein LCGC14_2893040, partial [marine sediment metagenome]